MRGDKISKKVKNIVQDMQRDKVLFMLSYFY